MNSTGNQTGGEFVLPYFKEPQWLEISRLTFQVFIASVGLVGNAMVCLVITFQPQMHTVINFFIRNLAIADLGIIILSFPLAVIKEQNPYHWPLGECVCRYVFPLADIFHGVSVWSITLIAIDRYRALVRGVPPTRNTASFKSARWMIASVWMISFLIISLPQYFVMEFIDYSVNQPSIDMVDCTPNWPNMEGADEMRQIYLIGVAIFWYVLPLVIIGAAFCSISRKLQASSKFNKAIREECSDSEELKSTRKRLRERQNSKAKKLLIPVVVVFAITMLPYNVLRFALLYWNDITEHKYLWVYFNVCVTFVVANSSANFFIYSLVSDEFRQSFKRLFCRNSSGSAQSATDRAIRSPLSRTPMNISPLNLSPLNTGRHE